MIRTTLEKRVQTLRKKKLPEQRTPEWFEQRRTRITASEAANCLYKTEKVCGVYNREFGIKKFKENEKKTLNPYETREEYITKKCDGYYGEITFTDNEATLWGKRYEEVANRLYKKIRGTVVYEFGLVPHGRLKWLGASPDGITREGTMLEIKCPKSRKIKEGAPPIYYWIQVQIQLEVCNLEECDFLECEIEEIDIFTFENIEIKKDEKRDIGIMIEVTESDNTKNYIYPPDEITTKEGYIEWKNEIIENDQNCREIYFEITKYNIITIKRSKEWFDNVRDDIKKTWDIIRAYQQDKEEFLRFKEMKNKKYKELYEATVCLIEE